MDSNPLVGFPQLVGGKFVYLSFAVGFAESLKVHSILFRRDAAQNGKGEVKKKRKKLGSCYISSHKLFTHFTHMFSLHTKMAVLKRKKKRAGPDMHSSKPKPSTLNL